MISASSTIMAEMLAPNRIEFPHLGFGFNIDPTAFTIFGLDIQWYGIIITLGLILAIIYVFPRMKRFGIDSDRAVDAVIGGVLGLIGSIIGGVFSGLASLASGAFSGGSVAAGVVIGLALYFWLKKRNAESQDETGGTVDGETVETEIAEPRYRQMND